MASGFLVGARFLPALLRGSSTSWTSGVVVLGLLAVFCFPLALLSFQTVVRRRKLRPIPKAPGSVPLLGNLIGVGSHPLPWQLMLDWCYQLNSDVVRWNLPFEDWIIVRGGDCMRAVLQTNFKHFSKETAMSFKPFLCILGTGLVTSHGQLWQQQRKLMTPAFKGDALMSNVIGISVRAVKRLMDKLDRMETGAETIEIGEEFRLLTLQVITEAIMSLPHDESDRVFPRLYLPIMEECHRRVFARWRPFFIFTPSWWQHRSRCVQLDSYIGALIQQRWQRFAKGAVPKDRGFTDMLDLILEAKAQQGEVWSGALERQLCYEIKTFLLAGHETSAAMLTFSLVELLHDDDIRRRVVEEADRVLGPDGSRVPSKEEVQSMTFTMACLRETLRKYSVVPVVTRVADRDTELGGYAVPAGCKVVLHFQGTHEMWKDADAYRPERFLPGGEFEQFPEDVRRFMFVPFGEGPRVCIGQHFSLLESRVVLASLVQRYNFRLERPYKMQWTATIIPLQPIGGVPVSLASTTRS